MEIFLTINLARFHPLLVHIPIGVLFFAFFLEIYGRVKKRSNYDGAINLALLVGAIFSVFSAGSGWLLSQEGGYDEAGLFWHKWLGVATAFFSILIYIFHRATTGILREIYFLFFMLVVGLLIATGHYGGNMTHGEGYLFSGNELSEIEIKDGEPVAVYKQLILPIFVDKCMTCHKPGKKKGELLMTSKEAILKGGKSGTLFDFDKPSNSLILKRIHLPLEEKKHMPPKGKRQLNEDEIELLKWWVENKACFDCRLEEMEGNDVVQHVLDKYAAPSGVPEIKVPSLNKEIVQELQSAGLRVQPLSEGSSFLAVNLSNRSDVNKAILKRILAVGENVVNLDLSHSNISDKDFWVFNKLPNLKKVNLQKTDIADEGLKGIKDLKYLERLNIYGTKVTDVGLSALIDLPSLNYLNCWETGVTKNGIEKLIKEKPQLEIQYELEKGLFGEAVLGEPEIIAESDFFEDSVKIELKSNFRDAKIYFTLDDSQPDSNSNLYVEPFLVSETTKLKAVAQKKGWENSAIASRNFISSKTSVASVKLTQAPNEKYKADGAASLIDRKRGTTKFTDGMWLGYEGEHLEAVVELVENQSVSKIFVSALAAPGSWILFPSGCEISISENGSDFNLIKKMELLKTEPEVDVEQRIFEIPFEEVKVKYVKVKIQSPEILPNWHPAAGQRCWIFVDEIILN